MTTSNPPTAVEALRLAQSALAKLTARDSAASKLQDEAYAIVCQALQLHGGANDWTAMLAAVPTYHEALSGGGETTPKSKTASNPILQGPTREEVARIIDPDAFATVRQIAAARGLDAGNPPDGVIIMDDIDKLLPNREAARNAAYAKADAVLLLGET